MLNDRTETIAKIDHVQILTLRSNAGPAGYVSFAILNDIGFGPKLVNLLEESIKDKKEKMKTSKMLQINDFSLGEFLDIEADISRKLSFKARDPNNEKVDEFDMFRICRGVFFLEIEVINNLISDDKIVEISEEIFKRCSHFKTNW